MTNPKNIFSLKNFLLASAAVFFMSGCQEQEEQLTSVSENAEVAKAAASGSNVESLTITGENTSFVGAVDCKTCTYFVAASEKMIDGNKLGIKPGSVICLENAVKYGSIEFVNVAGTENAPITIGTCTK
jgi:hypothetical protein